ncbi:unnamed protein product [Owenia fusiformis]|uniref:Uncharacterized protein n=1 Tax=Owenia fusiformis TaxID=6347 RepID=A0A8S4PL90_OWEFU|nr:unnamed protein product [Owenia fusiformis]
MGCNKLHVCTSPWYHCSIRCNSPFLIMYSLCLFILNYNTERRVIFTKVNSCSPNIRWRCAAGFRGWISWSISSWCHLIYCVSNRGCTIQGLEQFDWYNLPWGFLCGSAVLGLAFNFLVNFGIAFTFPLFISVGTVLGIPLNAGVDAMFRGRIFGVTKIIATIMIIVGFILVLIPTDKCCGGRAITISQGMSDSQSKTGEKKKLLDKECRSDTNTRL